MSKKMILIYIVLILVIVIGVCAVIFRIGDKKALEREVVWGATFSQTYSEELGLDWKETYLEILDNLNLKTLRLIAYWDLIEPKDDEFDFEDLDWQIREAEKRGIDVLLTMGRRTPRWPECRYPKWLVGLREDQIQEKILESLKGVVGHYKDFSNIKAWQIENEPLFELFGMCPPPDKEFLKQEIGLVKSLDDRPIVITDSGELSFWFKASKLPDILGVTMYRVVYNKFTGYFHWPVPPAFYRIKARLVNRWPDKIINTELQAEPWSPAGNLIDVPIEKQYKSMDVEQLNKNFEFAQKTGFSEVYIWGVEWWYWLKTQGDDSMWRAGQYLLENLNK